MTALVTQPVSASDVEAAFIRLRSVVQAPPLVRNERLSAATGANVWVKREDLHPVRSYKLRGAYNFIAQLSRSERERGVVTASAGNHAQGVAYACATLGLTGRIYVPGTTPRQKRDRIRALGGAAIELIVAGETYDDAARQAHEDSLSTGAVEVHAFDHRDTMAGQGTLAVEVVEQLGHAPDMLIVPVGGGGMLAGCVTWLAARHPQVEVVGVEPSGARCMAAAVEAGEPVELERIDTFCDGAAVRRAGAVTYPVIAEHGIRLLDVAEGRVCTEMLDLYQVDGIIAEPAGALASAALLDKLAELSPAPGSDVVVVLSGGNNDVSRYADIVERSLVNEGRKHYFLVNFPQEPGALRRFVADILGPDDDITLFEYVKRSNRETGPALVGIELGNSADLDGLIARMQASTMTFEIIPADSPTHRYLI
ncbi:MAG: threonine ammonia-lyase IlvA [Dermatophilus congolensis]|nr:threonine ammonia-lyase IlvA [Dermatophilus congolensis]